MPKTIQVLKNVKGHTIGKIVEANGKLEILDESNNRLGRYDPKTDRTTDRDNHAVGRGNLLTSLLGPKPSA